VSGQGRVELELDTTEGSFVVGWDLTPLRAIADRLDGEPSWSLGGEVVGAPLLRVLSAALEDGTAIGLAAAQPATADGHGDEQVVAFIARRGEDPQPVLDARLSTEYDAEGLVRRAGLELWLEESGPPARGAGDRESRTEVRRGDFSGETVRMTFRLDGVPGIAVYDLLRSGG
jgi:hypothetical protein